MHPRNMQLNTYYIFCTYHGYTMYRHIMVIPCAEHTVHCLACRCIDHIFPSYWILRAILLYFEVRISLNDAVLIQTDTQKYMWTIKRINNYKCHLKRLQIFNLHGGVCQRNKEDYTLHSKVTWQVELFTGSMRIFKC